MSALDQAALDIVIARAAENHQAAEKELVRARARLQSAEATFSTLENYRGEYANKLRGVTHFRTDSLGNYHRFLGRLSLALHSQKHDIVQAGKAVELQQKDCFESLRKLKAVELLRNRRASVAQAHAKRQEQKQSDEFATRSVQHNRRYT